MSGLPAFFEQTSDESYDRHTYKVYCPDGSSIEYNDYMDMRAAWFQTPSQFRSHVEVKDVSTRGKGF